MHKSLFLSGALLCALFSYCQRLDTLVIYYKSDQYTISKKDKQKLDSFLLRRWDYFFINGYTDETDEEDYNMELSKKRSGKVYDYFVARHIEPNMMSTQYFGETMPTANNESEEGRALNRRTEIIGYQYPRIQPKPVMDPMKPLTQTLDNGFIITYRPGALPDDLVANLARGSGKGFRLISNTTEMRQNNFYNNTTRGEILSSMLIISFDYLKQCKIDSPVLLRVPVPFQCNCSLQKLKFFAAVWENGARIWKEQNERVFAEVIDGKTYACVWLNNFCGSVNFDFKIPECYDTDSTQVLFVNADIRKFTTELKGLNSVYIPRKVNDSTLSIVYLKNKLEEAPVTFGLYNGKRRVRGFSNLPLSEFPYDAANDRYLVAAGSLSLYFPKVKLYEVTLKVNGEKYRVEPEENKFDFVYLKRKTNNITVDIYVLEKRGRMTVYSDQPLSSLPFDEATGQYVVDKDFLKSLKKQKPQETIAMR